MPNNYLAALEFIARHGGTEGTEDGQLVEWDGLSCAAIAQRALAAGLTPQDAEARAVVDGDAAAAPAVASWDAFQLIAESKGWDTTKNADGRWNDRTIQGAWFGYQAACEAAAALVPTVDLPDQAVREAWRAQADVLLQSLPNPNGPDIRRAARLLQDAYIFAEELSKASDSQHQRPASRAARRNAPR